MLNIPLAQAAGAPLLDAVCGAVQDHLGTGSSAGELVLGLPLNMDGTEGPRAKAVRKFATRLADRARCHVHLHDLDAEVEEAAASLGARRRQTFGRVILPLLVPAVLTGFALAFARALGEYGSVVFISGNMPMKTEIVPLLIVTKLEQYDTVGATAIAAAMLVASFLLLLVVLWKLVFPKLRAGLEAREPWPPPRAASRPESRIGSPSSASENVSRSVGRYGSRHIRGDCQCGTMGSTRIWPTSTKCRC